MQGASAKPEDAGLEQFVSTHELAHRGAGAPDDDGTPRGREAERPEQIPRTGWRDIAVRVWKEIRSDNVSLVPAGLALYTLLAVFPALAAAVSLYGLFATPAQVSQHMRSFAGILPPGTWEIFSRQLQDIAGNPRSTLTATAVMSLLVALWSARSGMSSLMTATNIAYSQQEKRGFIRQILVSLAFTVAAIVTFVLMLLLGVAFPLVLNAVGFSAAFEVEITVARWGLLWLVAVVGLAVIYRYGPARSRARWRWVMWGAVMAATVWLGGSLLFALYVRTFGTYGRTYGALGGVIVLLMWFYLSSFIVVLGAKVNAEMERQTTRDTTEGPEKPMGERGAYVADTVGPAA
jgi:membrane protein